ncbi:MAG: hypothetical protein GY694_14055 [Gammaproteobacteria bacterium]|nr:hypothetical protein [Gammaproteobacteria bacterium]
MSELIKLLITCETLLRSVGEKFWADKIKRVLGKDEESLELYLLKEILSWYGGMGSFNDLMISEYNNHILNGKDEEKLNDDLMSIRSAIYEEVIRLTE